MRAPIPSSVAARNVKACAETRDLDKASTYLEASEEVPDECYHQSIVGGSGKSPALS